MHVKNTPSNFLKDQKKGFTLIELLVVIAILAVLAVAVTLIINPAEFIRQGRDSIRLSDLAQINKALGLYQTDKIAGDMGDAQTVYLSIPDTSSSCPNLDLPALPSGWSYHCVSEDNLQKVDGSGWIPVDLTSMSFSAPLSRYPVDPINTLDSGKYYVYISGSWYISATMESERRRDDVGTIYVVKSEESVSAPGIINGRACGDGGVLTDSRDGNTYQLTLIGEGDNEQCWFAENLDYDDGCSEITWINSSDVGWCGYHSSDTGEENGLLYQWSAAMDGSVVEGAQGLCPSGWHLPTDQEFKQMEMSLGMSSSDANDTGWRGSPVGGKLKLGGSSTPGWSSETCGDTTCNISGWSATGGGYRYYSDGALDHWRARGRFWSSSPSGGNAWRRYLYYSSSDVSRLTYDQAYAFSVRCLRD